MTDWTDEARAFLEERAEALEACAREYGHAPTEAGFIRAALGEIERRGERLAQWEREEVTRAANCCGQEERAEAAEAKLAEAGVCVSCDKPGAILCRQCAREEFEQARIDRDEAISQAVSIGRESKKLEAEVERLKSERHVLYAERGLLRAAVRKLLSFEASCGEQDIPEEDRIFARAALRGGGE